MGLPPISGPPGPKTLAIHVDAGIIKAIIIFRGPDRISQGGYI